MTDLPPAAPSTLEAFVWLHGRLRRHYTLAGPTGEELGTYELGPRRGALRAADGRDWEFRNGGTTASAKGRVGGWATVRTDEDGSERLVVDGQVYRHRLDRRAGQHARLTDAAGAIVLDARNPDWKGGPFRAIAVSDAVPQAFGVVALIGFLLIYAYEDLRGAAARTGGGGDGP